MTRVFVRASPHCSSEPFLLKSTTGFAKKHALDTEIATRDVLSYHQSVAGITERLASPGVMSKALL
jgi:hypothetical protein